MKSKSATTSRANLWDSSRAKEIAGEIANISGLYCGPAVVGWIAAVWNLHHGISYDYLERLPDKSLFPDGPRKFGGFTPPGFQRSLDWLLQRETDSELRLSEETYYRYGNIHDKLEEYDQPIILRMFCDKLWDGLHYTALYQSEKDERRHQCDRIKFYWMDNGVYGRKDGGNPGLYATAWRTVGQGMFITGAKRVSARRLQPAKHAE